MIRRLFAALFPLLILSGCAPLKQIDWKSSNENIRISPGGESLDVTVRVGVPTGNSRAQINEETSYAEKSGSRFKIRVRANEYADKFGGPWRSWHVHLADRWSWGNGDWRLHLEFTGTESPIPSVDADFKLWTFFYSPFVHGAPN